MFDAYTSRNAELKYGSTDKRNLKEGSVQFVKSIVCSFLLVYGGDKDGKVKTGSGQ